MKSVLDQVSFLKDAHCSKCGYPVIDACCNTPFTNSLKDGELYDYWQYCTNKSCEHHAGEGIGHDWSDWVERENKNHLTPPQETPRNDL